MLLGDFHIHSTFSDGKLTIPEIIDLYGSHGFGAIAITDHLCEEHSILGKAARALNRTLTQASFPLYMNILRTEADRAWRKYRMVVIPGIELSQNNVSNHRSAHVLGLGVQEYIPAEPDVKLLARAIRDQGGLAIAAHPVNTRKAEKQTYHLWNRREELKEEFDAWEVASGVHIFPEVAQTSLPKIASSDLHHRRQFSSWKTVLKCERSQAAIFDSIRKQEIDFYFFKEAQDGDPILHPRHPALDPGNIDPPLWNVGLPQAL